MIFLTTPPLSPSPNLGEGEGGEVFTNLYSLKYIFNFCLWESLLSAFDAQPGGFPFQGAQREIDNETGAKKNDPAPGEGQLALHE